MVSLQDCKDYNDWGSLFEGCWALGDIQEETFYDLDVPDLPFDRSAKASFRKDIQKIVGGRRRIRSWNRLSGGRKWEKLRILFPSGMCLEDSNKILEFAIDEDLFDCHQEIGIKHLSFGMKEVVHDYNIDADPASVSIETFGKILTRVGSVGETNKGIESLTLDHIRFVGRSFDEYRDAFETKLVRSGSIREFICRQCVFLSSVASHRMIINSIFEALNAIDALQVLSISHMDFYDIPDHENAFADFLKKNHSKAFLKRQNHQRCRKPLSVVSISNCKLSNHTIEVLFGHESRVEKLSFGDSLAYESQAMQIPDLLCYKNRNLRYLSLYTLDGDVVSDISESISLLKALETNRTLEFLDLDLNCCNAYSFHSSTADLIDSIRRMANLKILNLNFRELDLGSMEDPLITDKSIECISSILRLAVGENPSIKKVNFHLDGAYHEYNPCLNDHRVRKASIEKTITNAVNESIIHALKNTESRCSLEALHIYVDGMFTIHINEETEFWMSLNRKNMRLKLQRHPNDFKLWRDTIIVHRFDPSVVYCLLRQNHALLISSAWPSTNSIRSALCCNTTDTDEH